MRLRANSHIMTVKTSANLPEMLRRSLPWVDCMGWPVGAYHQGSRGLIFRAAVVTIGGHREIARQGSV